MASPLVISNGRFSVTLPSAVVHAGACKALIAHPRSGCNPDLRTVNYFRLAGVDDKFILYSALNSPASAPHSFGGNDPLQWDSFIQSSTSNYSFVFGPAGYDRAWALVLKAFDDESVLLTCSGVVTSLSVTPEDVRAAMNRAALGESVTIPAATTSRFLLVDDICLSKSGPRQVGGASAGKAVAGSVVAAGGGSAAAAGGGSTYPA